METSTFVDRIVEILRFVNSQQQAGQNQFTFTEEQFETINTATDINTASSYLLAYGIPNYIIDLALDENQSVDTLGSYDLSLQSAMNEFGLAQPGSGPIGVTASYVSPRGESATEYYTENELVDNFAGLGEEQIASIQASLINAGLLQVDAEFIAGDYGQSTQRAMSFVLGTVNRRGVTEEEKVTGSAWKQALAEYELNPLPKYPDADTYLPPDFASVSNTIKTMFRRGLNRDPQPYELKLLANTLYSESQQAYQQSVDLDKATQQQDVTGTGLLDGEFGNYSKENVQAKIDSEGLTQIDPLARVQFGFDNMIQNELGRLGENVDTRRTRASILSSINQRPQ